MALIRPEDELILCCARVREDPERAAQIRVLLQGGMDWAYVLRAARGHGMAPLLFWHLNATRPEAVPTAVLDLLRSDFYANNLRNLLLTGELLRLLNVFEGRGIPAIPYKGPVLAAVAYGNLALRQFIDLDILVHKQDVSRARELLISLGYRPDHQLTRGQEAALFRTERQYVFTHEDKGSKVELHWAIMPRFLSVSLDPERLWKRLERVSLGGDSVPTLSAEDLLLILCVHGSVHLWERLGWVCDVAELVSARKGMNWAQAAEQAAAQGSERMLFLGLFLANDLLGAALPEEILQKVKANSVVRTLAGQVQERLFLEPGDPPRVFEQTFFYLSMRERLQDKIRYCIRLATNINAFDWALVPLPSYLFPLYYVIRPIRLIGKYVRRLLGHAL